MKREFTKVRVGVEVVIGAGGVIGGLCGVAHGLVLGGFSGALCSFLFEAYLRVEIVSKADELFFPVVVVSHCFLTRERESGFGDNREEVERLGFLEAATSFLFQNLNKSFGLVFSLFFFNFSSFFWW